MRESFVRQNFIVPTLCVTAIKLSVYRNAKLQLGWQIADAKLELGVPSRADFTLNLMAVKPELGNQPKFTPICKRGDWYFHFKDTR